ncbi:hypothetical protein BHO26_000116 [Shigella flexneri]|nr:hypothetical protein [Shigella flexneri]
MKKNICRVDYGEVVDDDGVVIYRVWAKEFNAVVEALDHFVNGTRENVRATSIDSLIDTSRKRRKKDE